ncbi:hypothetical protein BGW39_005102 [Mortierella sp. 14UC]|nr:hypothetical protein BGW39_005102 [Mortierella sp. 14UC]
MFLPWSFFTLNLFFLALDILVAAFLAALLARISRRVGGYAQSIRWIKQAGYWEMITALCLSIMKCAWRPWLALLTTLLGSIALTGLLIEAKSLFTISTGELNPSREVAASTQFITSDAFIKLAAWSTPVQYETRMEDILAKAFNNTKANPRASPTKRYRPRLSDYELACDRLDVRVFNGSLFLPNDGCATFVIYPPLSVDINTTTSYILQTSKGRAKAVMPARAPNDTLVLGVINDISQLFWVKYEDQNRCATVDRIMNQFNATRVGITSSPTTVLTKCQLLSGQMVSLSTTTLRFSAPNQQMFQSVAKSILGDEDELVSAMQNSVNDGTLTDLPDDILERIVVMEVKVVGTQVTALTCVGSKQPGSKILQINCAYTIANILITKPRPMNLDIAQALSNKNYSTNFPFASTLMTLTHLPLVSESTPSYAMTKIFDASSVAATYLAYLGQNFVMDWDGSTMYIAYDTVDIVKGYDFPGWLFILMFAVMIACLIFWGVTERWVEEEYKRSLYWLVSKSLAPAEGKVSPMLYRFDPDKLEFEGRRIVSTKELPESEKETVVYEQSLSGSEDPLVAIAL